MQCGVTSIICSKSIDEVCFCHLSLMHLELFILHPTDALSFKCQLLGFSAFEMHGLLLQRS